MLLVRKHIMTGVSLEKSGREPFSDIGLGINGAGKRSVNATVIGWSVVHHTDIGERHPLISGPHHHNKHTAIKSLHSQEGGEGFRFSSGSASR